MDVFERYNNDINKAWIYQLSCSFNKINTEISCNCGKRLREPIFSIMGSNTLWGSWNPKTRVLSLSLNLLRNFEWGAVERVLRHEMAHQIVSEIFDMDCYGVAHGAAWERACKMVNIPPVRCDSASYLSEFKGTGKSKMFDRVKKLLLHANDESITEEEASLFMCKARELMLRHNIEMKDVMGSDRVWVSRPFGLLYKRFPSYMWSIANLLKDFYDVRFIKTYYGVGRNSLSRLELFGEPSHLDIAEYVGHALLNQAEILYEEYKLNRKQGYMVQDSDYRYYRSRISKRAFIEGLVSGYRERLEADTELAKGRIRESYGSNDMGLIPVYDERLLEEMYDNKYTRRRILRCYGSRGEGRSAGLSAGRNLRLSRGVSSSGNNGRLLN